MKAFMVVEGKRKQLYVDSKQLTEQRNGHLLSMTYYKGKHSLNCAFLGLIFL